MKIYNWSSEKNELLIFDRGISFEEVVFYIENGGLLDEIVHPNSQEYSNQRIFIGAIENYVYLIPHVDNEGEIFLKTIIPSRKFTKIYLGDGE